MGLGFRVQGLGLPNLVLGLPRFYRAQPSPKNFLIAQVLYFQQQRRRTLLPKGPRKTARASASRSLRTEAGTDTQSIHQPSGFRV